MLVLTVLLPHFLYRLKTAWMGLGFVLGTIINPIVLGIIFFSLIVPVGLLTRIVNRDELLLKNKKFDSMWKENDQQPYSMNFFRRQF